MINATSKPTSERWAIERRVSLRRFLRERPPRVNAKELWRDQGIDREHAGAFDDNVDRHGQVREVGLQPMTLARRQLPVEKKAVFPIDRSDRPDHDDGDSERGGPREQSDDQSKTAEKLEEADHVCDRRRQTQRGHRADGPLEAVTAEPAEDFLRPMG